MTRRTATRGSLLSSVGIAGVNLGLVVLLAGSGCAFGIAEPGEEPPVVVGLTRSGVAVGESLGIIGGNFLNRPDGYTKVILVGDYTTLAGDKYPVEYELRPHWENGNEMTWSPIGPYTVPFSPTGDELGIFDGTITATNVKDGLEYVSEATPVTLEILPSLILTELQPVDAECAQPSKVILDTFNYKIGVRAIGFTPVNYTYVSYSPYTETPRIQRVAATGMTNQYGLRASEGDEFYFDPVPEELPFYVGTMVAASLGDDGIERALALNIGVHRPIEFILHDEFEVAQIKPAQPDGGCNNGGNSLPVTVTYEESEVLTRERQLGVNWSEDWLESHSGTVSQSRTETNSIGAAVNQDVQGAWEYEVERGRDIGGQGTLNFLAEKAGGVTGSYINIRREKGKLYGSVTDGYTVNQDYSVSDTESWAFTGVQSYQLSIGGSDFWTVSSTTSITKGFPHPFCQVNLACFIVRRPSKSFEARLLRTIAVVFLKWQPRATCPTISGAWRSRLEQTVRQNHLSTKPSALTPTIATDFLRALAVCIWLLPSVTFADIARVWAVSDGTKVAERDLGNPLALGNEVFAPEPGTIALFGLRNETVAFQLVVEGGAQTSESITVELDGIGTIANGDVGDGPDRYFLGRHIEIFNEHRVVVDFPSHDLMWEPGSDAAPKVTLGNVADGLVPHRQPELVAAKNNKVFWVDVWIPRDAAATTHRGVVVVKAEGRVVAKIAVALEVGEASLPDEVHSKTMVWFSAGSPDGKYVFDRYLPRAQQNPQALQRLRRRHHQLARRHRLTLFWGKHQQPNPAWALQLSGRTFSEEEGYAGPGENLGDDVAVLAAYGGELAPAQARVWQRWLSQFAAVRESFLYVRDEPPVNPRTMAHINAIASAAKPIRSFVTTPFHPGFAIDIFAVPAHAFSQEMAAAGREHGSAVWIYNGVRPFTGTFAIDDVAISPRVNPWLQYRAQISRWFYWDATYYLDFQGDRGPVDVWRQAHNFSNRHGDRVNGDGLLMYPGTDLLFPGSAPGVDRPLPSIRLKNWRRGIEDVEYLHLAAAAGRQDLVDQVATALVPESLQRRALDEPVSWPEDGESWLRARRLLFDAIEGNPSSVSVASLRRSEETWTQTASRHVARWQQSLWGSKRRRWATSAVAVVSLLFLGLLWRLRRRKV